MTANDSQIRRCACGFVASAFYFKGGKCGACRTNTDPAMWNRTWGRGPRAALRVEMAECRCGCGAVFNRYGDGNRPRAYASSEHLAQHARARAKAAMVNG